MVERKRFLSRVAVMAIAFVVGSAMLFAGNTTEVSAASSKPGKVIVNKYYSVNYNTVRVQWKKAKGASKYQVYRATSKNGKYKKVKTTKSLSFTNTGLTTGKNYYYKVRAVSKSGKTGKYSYRKVVKPTLKTPSLKIVDKGQTSVKITYSRVNGASGYQVYRRASGASDYARIGSYKELTVKDTGLKCETRYYYKVRAYKKVDGKYVYGSFSSVQRADTAKHTCKWVYQGTEKDKCSVCGATRNHQHIWKPVYKEVDNGYYKTEKYKEKWFRCNDCGEDITGPNRDDSVASQIYASKHTTKHVEEETVYTEEVLDDDGCIIQTNYRADGTIVLGSYNILYTKERQVWVPKIEKVLVGYKCACGAEK